MIAILGVAGYFLNKTAPRDSSSLSSLTSQSEAWAEAAESSTTILAFGDMMLDRAVRTKIDQYGAAYPFQLIEGFLTGNDIVVANAKGAFTSNPSVAKPGPDGPLVFTFDPGVLPTLKKLGFTLFSQANNHSLGFGAAGLADSHWFMERAGLAWFGDPLNQDLHVYVTTTRGVKVAFVGYHQFTPGGIGTALAAIGAAKQSGAFVIVYPHWGVEYESGTTTIQTADAHAFVDAGADVILGAHPHVIEPVEIYRGRAIFYSLGNFIFDQAQTGPTSQGLAVRMSVASSTVSYQLYPFDIRHAQASLMDDADRVALLASLAAKSSASDDVKAGIEGGRFSLSRD